MLYTHQTDTRRVRHMQPTVIINASGGSENGSCNYTVPLEVLRPRSKLLRSHDVNSTRVMFNLCWCNKSRISLIFTINFNFFFFFWRYNSVVDSQRGSTKHYSDNLKRSYRNTVVVSELHSACSAPTYDNVMDHQTETVWSSYNRVSSLEFNYLHHCLLFNTRTTEAVIV